MTNTTLSWQPPSFPPTIVNNDGTSANRYDVRSTLTHLASTRDNVNNIYMLYYITTKDGPKFHLNTSCGMAGSELQGTFVSLNDLQTLTARGASTIGPGKGSAELLQWESTAQSITAPRDGDKWTNTRMKVDFEGVKLDVLIKPTGGNLNYGGNGAICLDPRGPDLDPSINIPGWSWYWANPTTRIEGSLTIDDKEHEIDTSKSFALFERQWGNFDCRPFYFALWGWLETGEVFIVWGMRPTLEGRFSRGFASVWHPSGLHEVIPIGPNSLCSDLEASPRTGIKYFNKFFIDLPARKSSITFTKWIRDAELAPAPPVKQYITISESYGEGMCEWNGKTVRFFGHVEQLGGPE
ncbi:hypothetical protein B0T11DRAFT_326016 [Plectosphaerella cucumerina]|uniref:Uncharacterized protein n=1 Tax=Plectosphaerella cucumerina TaxID=40658 RepID=A0A8K0TIJ6_9PEZI|nr:hypothetical protein B0T11DRAFT_326016 [Plectosphaerella cucumerina]